MKWMIASDIHGSAYFCRLTVEAFKKVKAQKLLLLGDLLYHEPRNDLPAEYDPKNVIGMLNPLADRILAVRGNCEAEVDQMVLDFPVLADYALIEASGVSLFATHGHVYNPDNPPPVAKGSVLLNGHTHVPACVEYDNYTYMNPGSVSIPKENSVHSFMTLENATFSWIDLETGQTYRQYEAGKQRI